MSGDDHVEILGLFVLNEEVLGEDGLFASLSFEFDLLEHLFKSDDIFVLRSYI